MAKATHPWLDSIYEAAIHKTSNAISTPDFPTAQIHCAECLNEKQAEYVARLKAKLRWPAWTFSILRASKFVLILNEFGICCIWTSGPLRFAIGIVLARGKRKLLL